MTRSSIFLPAVATLASSLVLAALGSLLGVPDADAR